MKFRDWNDLEHDLPAGGYFVWRPSAYALVANDNKILIIKSAFHGKWEFPGGAVELGESLHDGAVREVLEETGYTASLLDKVPFYLEDEFFYVPITNKYFQSIRFIYNANLSNSEKKKNIDLPNNEVLDIKWIRTNEIPKFDFNQFSINSLKRFFKHLNHNETWGYY